MRTLLDRLKQAAFQVLVLALLVPALTIGLGLIVAVVIVTLLSAILGVNQLAF